MRYAIWTTKDGKKIPINKLADDHLLNILKLLINRAVVNRVKTERAYLFPAFGGPRGEMAQDCFDQEFDRICELTTENYLPNIWWKLESEARKRKLSIPEMPDEALVGVLALQPILTRKKNERQPKPAVQTS